MKNWIRIGGHYINLDHVTNIVTDAQRTDYAKATMYQDEPCVIFNLGVPNEMSSGEIRFFGEDRERILAWLSNEVELEITNLNFIEKAVA